MMIKIFLISACVAASANAGWEWNGNDNNPSGGRNRRMRADSHSQFANMPDFPDFPHIPDMPNFDNLFPKLNFPEIKMREIKMPHIKISPEDIASHKGSGYTGVSMVTINGKTVVTLNDGGNVETYTVPAGASKEEISAILAGTVLNN